MNTLIALIEKQPKLQKLLYHDHFNNIDKDPWKSNYGFVTKHENEKFCNQVAKLVGESNKKPRVVAIMRGIKDPQKIIKPFHNIHIDSRFSDKTLVVLKGSGKYPIFAHTYWNDFNLLEKMNLIIRQIIASLIEKFKIRKLQFKFTGTLPKSISNKVYKGKVKHDIPGEVIKFNNMLPHHSHMQPTEFNVLLQIVYT